MDEKKNVDETLDGVDKAAADGKENADDILNDIDALAEETAADTSKAKAEAEAAAKKADDAKDAASENAAKAAEAVEDVAETPADKAQKLAQDTAQKTADSADTVSETAAAAKEEAKPVKPKAKISPEYEKIVWPTAGRVWANTLTVIIVAALMAGTIFLVDMGLRAIIDGFMSI